MNVLCNIVYRTQLCRGLPCQPYSSCDSTIIPNALSRFLHGVKTRKLKHPRRATKVHPLNDHRDMASRIKFLL